MYVALVGTCALEDYQALLGIAQACGLVATSRSQLVQITPKCTKSSTGAKRSASSR
jgi:hypothetical protein